MRLTRDGRIVAALLLLTLLAALASGNNLLYLLYGLMLSALALSLAAAYSNLRGLALTARFPERIFRDTAFPLELRARNDGSSRATHVTVRWGERRCFLERIDPGEELPAVLKLALPHRGLNRLEGLTLASSFPLGFIERSISAGDAVGLALPRPREARSPRELEADLAESGELRPRKGSGDDLYGVREAGPSEDSRLINWKLSARTGKLLVNEYAERSGSRITVRVSSGGGESGESKIDAAASACKYYIDRGADVRLVTPETEVPYGKGLLQLDTLLKALALTGQGRMTREAKAPEAGVPPPDGRPEAEPGTHAWAVRWNHAGAALIFASFFLIEELSPAFLGLLAPLLPISWWLDARGGPRLPEPLWQAASSLILAYILLVGWQQAGITLANTHLLLYIMVNRLLSPKGSAELRQLFLILFLAFFLVSGQTISLWYFPFFIAYAAFAASWLMLASRRAAGADAEGDAGFPGRALAGVLAVLLAAAGLIFAATPRLEPLRRMNPFVAMGLDKRHPKQDFVVAFTEDVSLGFFGRLKKSSARVMRVEPLGLPEGTTPPALLIRGSALDLFDGRSWNKLPIDFQYEVEGRMYRSRFGKAYAPRRREKLVFPAHPGRKLHVMDFTLYPLNSAVIFTPGGAARIEEPAQGAYFDYSDTLYFESQYISGAKYRTYTPEGDAGYGAYIEGYNRFLNERFLQLPPLDPRVRALALELTAEAVGSEAKISMVLQRLERSYAYTTYSSDADATLVDFLFKARRGNCEYFATAAAILLRYAGVPTRLVTGFMADDWNEYGKFYDIRQGSAHAWIEAYVEGKGWMAVDATPPQDSTAQKATAVLEKLGRYIDSLQFRWYRHIIGYDRFVQRNTFLNLKLSLRGDAFQIWIDRAIRAASILLAVYAALLGLKLTLQRLRRPPETAWTRALSLLARAGLRPRKHQTPREFSRFVGALRPELAALGSLAELYYEERYSSRGATPSNARRLDELLVELRGRLTSSRRAWRWPRSPA